MDESTKQAAVTIRTAVLAVLTKLNNMLMTAKPKPPVRRVFGLRFLLTKFETDIASRMLATNTRFHLVFPSAELRVYVDPIQMDQVFRNLLGNSLDAIAIARATESQPAGKIELIVDAQDKQAVLLWRDDGCGISRKTRNSIFTPF